MPASETCAVAWYHWTMSQKPMKKVVNAKQKSAIASEFMDRASPAGSSVRGPNKRKHLTLFKGIVYDSSANELWRGEVDLAPDLDRLLALAKRLRESIYVTREVQLQFFEQVSRERHNSCIGKFPIVVRVDP